MREVLTLSTWRLSHWLVLVSSALYVTMYVGLVPPADDLMSWLSNRPEVVHSFNEPHFGRADALILVFSALFLGPFALWIGLIVLVFIMAVLGGFVVPIVRWFSMPEWFANVLSLGVVTAVAYTARDLWMPKTFWLIGLVARACRIVLA